MNRSPSTRAAVAPAAAWLLLTAGLVLVSLPVCAQVGPPCRGLSCGSKSAFVYGTIPSQLGETGMLTLRLRGEIAPDGTAWISGAIRDRRHNRGDTSAALGPYIPLLVAAKAVAELSSADADGDGALGIVRLAAEFRQRTGEPVPVVLTTLGDDAEATGRYLVAVQIGADTFTVDTKIRLVPRR
jgi:hypothetical protein